MKKIALLSLLIFGTLLSYSQIGMTPEYIKAITSEWKGERFPDGRPKIPDELLERAKHVSIEALWGPLRRAREGQWGTYSNQFQGGNWQILHPDEVMTGRAVTAQFLPSRPDVATYFRDLGFSEGRSREAQSNVWPLEILVEGDIYVADGMGKIIDGTLIGDNLGNSIYARSKRGVIFWGSVRDAEGLEEIPGFNAWILDSDPSAISGMMVSSINAPIRIGRATVSPGDLVVAKKYGVLFIPAHLAEEVVFAAEVTELRDRFGWQRLHEGKYTPAQIDSRWSDEINADYREWLRQRSNLPMPYDQLIEYLNRQQR